MNGLNKAGKEKKTQSNQYTGFIRFLQVKPGEKDGGEERRWWWWCCLGMGMDR